MFDIFISHSSKDKLKFVEPLVDELKKFDLNIWYDKSNITIGDKIDSTIINGINESLVFIAIISLDYYNSSWANFELGVLQDKNPDNLIPIIFPEAKEITGQKHSFLLNYRYLEFNVSISDIAQQLYDAVCHKKMEKGDLHIEKTNLKLLIKEIHSYNNFKLEQIAIHLSHINHNINGGLLSTLNEINHMIEKILKDVAYIEQVYISPEKSVYELFLTMDFLNQNLKEHIKFLHFLYQEQLKSSRHYDKVEQEEMYLIQLSVYSIVNWYMITYFKKPVLKVKNLVPVMPEEFSKEDIIEAYKIEELVLPPALIASLSTDFEWFYHNPLTIIGARDLDTGKLIGFFTSLPVSDNLYMQIKSGDFDDTTISINDIRQYDMPGFYKLYLCSFCIHPAYNTTVAFKIIYTSFIDFLLNLAQQREIFISNIIADGVTIKGANLCESIGMSKITTSVHNSNVYAATLIPPHYTTLKINNKEGRQLITYYQKIYNEYKDVF